MDKKDIGKIEEIKNRLNKTTHGKWNVEKHYHNEPYEDFIKSASVVSGRDTITRNDWSNPVEADLNFIANAKQDIQYLLTQIEKLEQEVMRLTVANINLEQERLSEMF